MEIKGEIVNLFIAATDTHACFPFFKVVEIVDLSRIQVVIFHIILQPDFGYQSIQKHMISKFRVLKIAFFIFVI